MRSFDMHASSNWRDYHYRPSRTTTKTESLDDQVKRLSERVAQLDCAFEGHEERIAELEQTVQELKASAEKTRLEDWQKFLNRIDRLDR